MHGCKGQFTERATRWVGQAGINAKSLSEFQIPLPPLEFQQEIVAEIEGYQNEIARFQIAIKDEENKFRATLAPVWGEDAVPAGWRRDHMPVKPPIPRSDLRGYSRLAVDATLG